MCRGTNYEQVWGPDQTSKVCFSSFKDLKLISTFTNLSMIGGFKFDNGPKVESYIKLLEHYKTLARTHSLTHSHTKTEEEDLEEMMAYMRTRRSGRRDRRQSTGILPHNSSASGFKVPDSRFFQIQEVSWHS